VRHLELSPDNPNKAREVCIHPGLNTNFFFDTQVARVELPGRERFRFLKGADGLGLLPVGDFVEGERVPVTVHFEDGAAPASATFVLVVHPTQAEGQVMVSRHTRTLASYQQGEQLARPEARQCQEDKERLRAECGARSGLIGLIANGWLGEGGIPAQDISDAVTQHPAAPAAVQKHRVISYRTARRVREDQIRVRVAVEVVLINTGEVVWRPVGAALVDAGGKVLPGLTLWTQEPIPPGASRRVVVEVEADAAETLGTFTLKLWTEHDGTGLVVLDGVTFPG
jgi:uncharacterized protein (TIGR02268 family)